MARFRAILGATKDVLPIARGVWFNHTGTPWGSEYGEFEDYLRNAPVAGDPRQKT